MDAIFFDDATAQHVLPIVCLRHVELLGHLVPDPTLDVEFWMLLFV